MNIIFYAIVGSLIMANMFWLFLTWPYALISHFFWNNDPYRQIALYGISIPTTLAWIGFLVWGMSKL